MSYDSLGPQTNQQTRLKRFALFLTVTNKGNVILAVAIGVILVLLFYPEDRQPIEQGVGLPVEANIYREFQPF